MNALGSSNNKRDRDGHMVPVRETVLLSNAFFFIFTRSLINESSRDVRNQFGYLVFAQVALYFLLSACRHVALLTDDD